MLFVMKHDLITGSHLQEEKKAIHLCCNFKVFWGENNSPTFALPFKVVAGNSLSKETCSKLLLCSGYVFKKDSILLP